MPRWMSCSRRESGASSTGVMSVPNTRCSSTVPLSSVRQPCHELGRGAAELLLHEADHPDRHRHRGVVLTPELVVRESSRPHR
jgi:DNA-binding LacI/PurR family transcriptional regulator